MGTSGKGKAFTLVELLVVMAIISMLAALLLPALEKTLLQARLASCTSQLRQQGLGFAQYADDNAGYWPYRVGDNMEAHRWMRPVAYGAPSIDYRSLITPYIEPSGLYACPAANLDWRNYWTNKVGEWAGYVVFAGVADNDGMFLGGLPWTSSLVSGPVPARWDSVSPRRIDQWPDRPIAGDALYYRLPATYHAVRILESADFHYSSPHASGQVSPGTISSASWVARTTKSITPPTNSLYPDGAVLTYSSGFHTFHSYNYNNDFLFWHRKE